MKWMLAALLVLGFTGAAHAQEPHAKPARRGVVTLKVTKISLRPQRPIAAVDVARARTRVAPIERRQPFVERIKTSVYRHPL